VFCLQVCIAWLLFVVICKNKPLPCGRSRPHLATAAPILFFMMGCCIRKRDMLILNSAVLPWGIRMLSHHRTFHEQKDILILKSKLSTMSRLSHSGFVKLLSNDIEA
jgi:hypothetical protein